MNKLSSLFLHILGISFSSFVKVSLRHVAEPDMYTIFPVFTELSLKSCYFQIIFTLRVEIIYREMDVFC